MGCRLLLSLLFVFCFVVFTAECHAVSFSVGGVMMRKDVKAMKDIRRENVVTQSLDVSCGPAGLATLFNYYLGDNVTEIEIINYLLNTVSLEKVRERNGFSMLDLKKFSESRGYQVTGYKMDADYLRNLKKPVLVPIKFRNYRHFVIVRGVLADRVFLADPTAGNVSMKFNKFKSMWSGGIGLLIEKKDGKEVLNNKLGIEGKDFFSVVNYRDIGKLMSMSLIRTATYSGEF